MLTLRNFKRYRLLGAIGLALAGGGCISLETTTEGIAVLAIVSGNPQTIQVGSTNAAPLAVRAYDVNSHVMEGVTVDWDVPGNGGAVSATTTVTDDTGTASVTYTPPSAPGTVQIRATAEGLTVTFNLTIIAAPAT